MYIYRISSIIKISCVNKLTWESQSSFLTQFFQRQNACGGYVRQIKEGHTYYYFFLKFLEVFPKGGTTNTKAVLYILYYYLLLTIITIYYYIYYITIYILYIYYIYYILYILLYYIYYSTIINNQPQTKLG